VNNGQFKGRRRQRRFNRNRCQRQGEQQSPSDYFFIKGLSRIRFVQLIRGAVALD
jgi:hypothetical protein